MMRPSLTTLCQGYLDALHDDGDPDPGLLGARGWTVTSGVASIVEPFVTLLPSSADDLAYFHGVDAEAAAKLLTVLDRRQLLDRHNDAPTLGVLLQAAVDHPGIIELHGYLVGPGRPDERISAEGVYVYARTDLTITPDHSPGCECAELWEYFQLDLDVNDARWMPHKLHQRVNAWRPDEPSWCLWWE